MSNVQIDTLDVYALAGGANGLALALKSNAYLADITHYLGEELQDRFNSFADAWSVSHLGAIDHMYEWNAQGLAAGRLWSTGMGGRGRSKTITFTYLPSKTFVPVPEELQEPGPTGDYVKADSHIFKNKAMVMELGTTVTILPKNAKVLAFMPMVEDKDGNIRPTFKTRAILTPGREVQGNFTAVWITWWNQIAPEVFEKEIGPAMQRLNANTFERAMKSVTRRTIRFQASSPGAGKIKSTQAEGRVYKEMLKTARRLRNK